MLGTRDFAGLLSRRLGAARPRHQDQALFRLLAAQRRPAVSIGRPVRSGATAGRQWLPVLGPPPGGRRSESRPPPLRRPKEAFGARRTPRRAYWSSTRVSP